MNITIFGATGMIDSRLVKEAAQRGHSVTAINRSGAEVAAAHKTLAMNLGDTAQVAATINAADASVITVSPDRQGGSHEPLLKAHRDLIAAKPAGHLLIVGGAGALEVNGVRLLDTPDFPAIYHAEASTFAAILDMYRASKGIHWTMLAPAPVIAPGARSGHYRVGTDSPVGDAISAEDFVVAIVDELENPTHAGTRFTVAN